jgi:hypothetical protein
MVQRLFRLLAANTLWNGLDLVQRDIDSSKLTAVPPILIWNLV